MKRLASVAALLLITAAGCENQHSRLDTVSTGSSAVSAEADHSGDLESRVRRLEDSAAKNAEALDFLNKVYAQQKQQQQAQEREEPAPDAVFAVDVSGDVQAGQVEGSNGALVTIVEAWDFA